MTDHLIIPVVQPCRRVPLSLQPKLKSKLDQLVKSGIISKVDEPTDWVNANLIVEIKNSS